MPKPKLSKAEITTLENERYKDKIINQRLDQIWQSQNRNDEKTFFHDALTDAKNQINIDLQKQLSDTRINEEKRYQQKLTNINTRFDAVDKSIEKTGDVLLFPFRSVANLVGDVQQGAFGVVDGVTGMLTSPLSLVLLGGVAYYFLVYNKNDES